MISKAEAKAMVAKAQGWFTGLSISSVKQDLWAEALTDERDLAVDDVAIALKRLATTPRDGYWRLEIAEIIDASKKVMRERCQLMNSSDVLLLPAQANPDDEQRLRTRIAAHIAMRVVAKEIQPDAFDLEMARMLKQARNDPKMRADLESGHASATSDKPAEKRRRGHSK